MNKTSVAAAVSGAFLVSLLAAPAAAQSTWIPGNEITGHAVRVDTNGVTNTVYFDPGGQARIVSQGGTEVMGRWSAANQQLCLETGANVRECWPYQTAFQAGQPVDLTSTCAVTSRWTPLSVQQMQPTMQRSGERG